MIKTLRVTSVLAVILAVVVLASVLGFLRPTSFLPLRAGTGGDKQTESILSGPSAVERFKTQYGTKPPDTKDTPPLIKQAELLAGIINPPELPNPGVKPPGNMPLTPTPSVKPPVPISSKFGLLGTCCSSSPRSSYAYIRLPDKTVQWVGVGEQIGHMTIKEIRKDSVLCWDGTRDSEVPIEAIPETSSLLETAKAADTVSSTNAGDSGTGPEPVGDAAQPTAQPAAANSVKAGSLARSLSGATKSPRSPAQPSSSAAQSPTAASQPAAPVTPAPSAQITKQEQEKLSRLGDRLKNNANNTDAAGQAETANRLINEFKSVQSLPPGVRELAESQTDPGPEPLRDTLRDEARRRYYSGRLTPPRAAKE
jgi:hypothetical protein